jgi:2'-5' RNA ligase
MFVAVAVDAGVRERLGRLSRRLPAEAAQALRWVPPEHLHLTLKFLGEVSDARLGRVAEAVHAAAEGAVPFTIGLEGVGAFPSPRRAQVVWVGVREGAERLVALAAALERLLAARRFPREARPFRPHLTVARVRGARGQLDLSAVLPGMADLGFGSLAVRALHIMESRLRPSGAVYRVVEEVGFQRRAGVEAP